jgi:hypothetical protein
MNFVKKLDSNSIIFTEDSSVVYYYTKKMTHYYINPWSKEAFLNFIKNNYPNQQVYVLFSINYNNSVNLNIFKKDLDEIGKVIFDCENQTKVYFIA